MVWPVLAGLFAGGAGGGAAASAAITAGGALLGGLIDGKARERDAYRNSPQGIRASAEAAGFNPLTVLSSGRNFGSGYTPRMGATIANGIAAGADNWTREKALAMEKTQLEVENQRLQKQANNAILNPNVTGIYGSTKNASALGADVASSEPVRSGDDYGERPLVIDGKEVDKSPDYSDTEDVETRYGEFISLPYGVMVAGADFMRNVYRPWRTQRKYDAKGATEARRIEYSQKYNPALNPPLRGYYGPPGSRTGF